MQGEIVLAQIFHLTFTGACKISTGFILMERTLKWRARNQQEVEPELKPDRPSSDSVFFVLYSLGSWGPTTTNVCTVTQNFQSYFITLLYAFKSSLPQITTFYSLSYFQKRNCVSGRVIDMLKINKKQGLSPHPLTLEAMFRPLGHAAGLDVKASHQVLHREVILKYITVCFLKVDCM